MDLTNLSLEDVKKALKNFGYDSEDIVGVTYMGRSDVESLYMYEIEYKSFDEEDICEFGTVFIWEGTDGELCGDY